ncbi:MAG: hypothetical protein KatS3mg057_1367 [Herpetosiphonaceae bacterium]|nr:MAG: hypothetical protein KatS3mg057_1367 [Herpetosiphonaceae bacterium]
MNRAMPLRRPYENRMIAGVASGLGRYFDIDPTLVRIAWALFTLFGGSGILFYLIAWFVIPNEDGTRSMTPLVILLIFFFLIPLLCFLFLLPFEILGAIF